MDNFADEKQENADSFLDGGKLDFSDLEDIFGENGLLSLGLSGYEYREAQYKMAKDAEDCYKTNSVYAVEAGTGIGKSFAYLVPALIYAFKNPADRTVIATSTINLQKQLVEKDLPALFKLFGQSCKVHLAVGRNNYLCLNRLEEEMSSFPLLLEDSGGLNTEQTELKRIYDFSKKSLTGLKSDYDDRYVSEVWYRVCSDADLCKNNKCRFFGRCYYFKAKRHLSEATIVVCNHHLLFTDSKYRYENSTPYTSDSVLPSFNRLVIDEAHNIDRNATSLYNREYSSHILRQSISRIYTHLGRVGQEEKRATDIAATPGIVARTGNKGSAGYAGSAGISDSAGYAGKTGIKSISDIAATPGIVGGTGNKGIAGYAGSAGYAGKAGIKSISDIAGSAGISATPGRAGQGESRANNNSGGALPQGTLLETLAMSAGSQSLVDIFDNVIKRIDDALSKAEGLNALLLSKFKARKISGLLINEAEKAAFFKDVKYMIDALLKSGGSLLESMNLFLHSVVRTDENESLLNEFKVYVNRVEAVFDVLYDFADVSKWGDDIHSGLIKRIGSGKKAYECVVLQTLPLNVSKMLQDALFSKIKSVFCTSATLDVKDDFAYWKRFVGLPLEGKKFVTQVYDSPFNYKERLMLLTPYDAKDYTKQEEDGYTRYVTQIVEEAASSAGGGALVLFTGYEMMRRVYNTLKPHFALMGINTLIQGEMDRYILLEHFKQDKDSVLFATASFWEGVDAPGETLRLVIITKLPFPNPEEPVHKARSESLKKSGYSTYDSFNALSLPSAIIHLKQGYGRLMRHTTDKGIVLILDSRITKKYYGQYMIHALPESYYPECSLVSIGQKIEGFLY